MEDIVINERYRHYKGNIYGFLNIAKHTETLEDLVIYMDMYGENKIWARPLSMWNEEVYLNGKKIKRFELIKG